MKIPTLSRRFWVAFTTVAVIGSLFAYYLLIYVRLREEKLRVDKYRVLARYGENMVKSRQDYCNTIERISLRSRGVIDALKKGFFHPASDTTLTKRDIDKKEAALRKLINDYKTERATAASIARIKSESEKCCCCKGRNTSPSNVGKNNVDLTKSDSSRIFWMENRMIVHDSIKKMVEVDFKNVSYDGYLPQQQFDSLQHYNFDRIYFSFRTNRSDRKNVFSILTKDFVYRPAQFDEFFIIKQFDRATHEHEKSRLVPANETYQTFQNRINLHSLDSFMVKEKGLLTSHFGEVKLADTHYELFVHSIRFAEDENWLLCGLMEKQNYNYKVRAVDPFVITVAALVLLFLLVAMPILKPLIMNTYERLSIANVWFAGFSLVYGGALLFVLIWSVSDKMQANDNVDKKLKCLSDTVKTRFENELISIYRQLDKVRSGISPGLIKYYDSIYVNHRKTLVYGNFSSAKAKDRDQGVESLLSKNYFDVYPYFNYILWIDSQGAPKITLTNQDVPQTYPMPELAERRYFSRARDGDLWDLPGRDSTRRRFALQSIMSWTNHEPEAGFGIEFDASGKSPFKVLAMSTRLSSVMDPSLPIGYGFCIIDESGEVWFHSNTRKNHQENLFLEVEHHGKLTAAVKGRNEAFFTAEYEGERARIYVQPIDGIPLHLVVFQDKDYQRTPVVLTIFFVFSLVAVLILVQAIQLLLLYLCEYSPLKIKRKGYFLKVLRPEKRSVAMYTSSIIAQTILVALCVCLFWWNCFPTLVGFITLPVMLMVFHQALHHGELRDKTRIIIFALLSFGLISLVNIGMSYWLSVREIIIMIGTQLLFAVVLGIVFLLRHGKVNDTDEDLNKVNPRKEIDPLVKENLSVVVSSVKDNGSTGREKWTSTFLKKYYIYLGLILLLNSILPVTFFYRIAHWQESVLWAKYEQLEAMETRIRRTAMLNKSFNFLGQGETAGSYPDITGDYLPRPGTMNGDVDLTGDQFQRLLFENWPRLADPFAISSVAAFNGALDKTWTWRRSTSEVEISYDKKGSKYQKHFTSGIKPFNPLAGSATLLILLLFVLSVVLIIGVLLFCCRYIFGIGLVPEFQRRTLDDIRQKLRGINRRLFIIGLPGSRKNDLKVSHPEISFISLFENGLNDHKDNQLKLSTLQTQAQSKDRSIVVLSPAQASTVMDVYQKWIMEGKPNGKPDEKQPSKKGEYQVALSQWKNVLSQFETYYLSIKPDRDESFSTAMERSELNSCYFLQGLKGPEISNLNEDDFIMSIGDIAEPYYSSLWSTFSPDEKLLLFDLACDGFVNLKNQQTIRILLQKGVLVVNDGAISIMNKSFSLFILNVYRQDEEMIISQKALNKGSWHNIQLVFVLVLIGIAIFIGLAQKELVGNINALIVAVTGALAMFSKFGGLFSSDTKAKPTTE